MSQINFLSKSLLIFFLSVNLFTLIGCATDKNSIEEPPKTYTSAYDKDGVNKLNKNNKKLKQFSGRFEQQAYQPEIKRIPIKSAGSLWLLIDTQKRHLQVKRGNTTLRTFNRIAIGRNGAGFKNKRGDNITPLGTFRIGWTNRKSKYRIFYGFTYPSSENAKEALDRGLITSFDYDSIVYAHQNNQVPPQNTPLVGRIGLHGLGKGNSKVHEMWDWTQGCTAVTNNQIDELSQWIEEGMTVKVK